MEEIEMQQPRAEEQQNLLLQLELEKDVQWTSRCEHGRWHLGAVCCVVLAVAMAFLGIGVLSRRGGEEYARALRRLDAPVVILISSDGFRYGYNWKAATPHIDRLIAEGVEAEPGMIPVFPSKTFPNHYSMATGLYPAYHGIVGNVMKVGNETFRPGNLDPKWWLGEPLWETAANQGMRAATYFWPGSQVKRGNWSCDPEFCGQYNHSVPYEERVDAVLSFLDRGTRFITLYFESPDTPGHSTGPDHPLLTAAVVRIDAMIGRLLAGLERRGLEEDVTLIMVGDHGMVANCEDRMIFLDDLVPREWVVHYSPVLQISPPPEVDVVELHSNLSRALATVKNAEYLSLYLKEQLPPRLRFSESSRIAPIVGLVAEGYTLAHARGENAMTCGGQHGYDNEYLSMRTVFMARGPQFARGKKVKSFVNVEIYQIVTSILGLRPAPNNGSVDFVSSLLLPHR